MADQQNLRIHTTELQHVSPAEIELTTQMIALPCITQCANLVREQHPAEMPRVLQDERKTYAIQCLKATAQMPRAYTHLLPSETTAKSYAGSQVRDLHV